MIVIVAVDDRNGMCFNGRRQSRDRVLRETILERTQNGTLWMNAYTRRQFGEEAYPQIRVSEQFLQNAEAGDWCFVEDQTLLPYAEQIERLILCHWQREYPADRYLDLDVTGADWILERTEYLTGYSHPEIIWEEYRHE